MAAEGAYLLDQLLWKGWKSGDCAKYQNELSKLNIVPWVLAVSSDLQFPHAIAENVNQEKLLRKFGKGSEFMLVAGSRYSHAVKCFYEISHMRPGFLWRLIDPLLIAQVLICAVFPTKPTKTA